MMGYSCRMHSQTITSASLPGLQHLHVTLFAQLDLIGQQGLGMGAGSTTRCEPWVQYIDATFYIPTCLFVVCLFAFLPFCLFVFLSLYAIIRWTHVWLCLRFIFSPSCPIADYTAKLETPNAQPVITSHRDISTRKLYVPELDLTLTELELNLDLGLLFCSVVKKFHFQANLTVTISYFWARPNK